MKKALNAAAGVAVLMAVWLETGLAGQAAGGVDTVPTHSFSGAYLAARAAETDNDLETAVAYYERALALDPDNAALQERLLLALVSLGRLEAALPYAQALKSVPEVERFSRLALAVDAFRKKDFAAAERWLKLVVESDLDRLITGSMTAWALAGKGELDAALVHLDGLEGPAWYDFFKDYQRALMLAQGGRGDDATEAFEAFYGALVPGAMAPETLGRAARAYAAHLSQQGRPEAALEVLTRAEELGGGVASIPVMRARLEAGETLAPVVSTPVEGAAEILVNVAGELANGGGDSFVRLYLNYALALRPGNDTILLQLARVAERQGEPERALALYRQIDRASPWSRFADFQIGLNLADMERYEEAVDHLKQVLEADPSDMRAYLALGGVYAAQEDYRSAARLYDRAVARIGEPERQHWNIFYQRGIAYERLKEWPKAEPNFKKALELYPNQPQVLNYLGYSWVDMNMNLEEALDLIRRAVELRPSDGYIVDSLGWAYYRLGRYEEAVEQLERAVSLRPEDPILNDHLGDAYWRVGRRLEAIYQWRHALALEPEPELRAEVEKKLEAGLPPPDKGRKVADAAGTARNVMNDGAPTVQPTREEAAPRIHTVRPGQTLWSIAVEELGDGHRYREILELNPLLKGDPNRIGVGQRLKLPPAE
ncbi:tetratricopeptide repeat protein [Chelativorans intermedius]|uniref:Tetratricopeptide repeat protein n=1 Tax=Chelativorans intermedius TaxID=515947 RepID=A0ABV6DA70_9HYPH|nr:tetratricopeptide repeat protein [Chelativorans intermedius]MCT8998613.1 tetratricopeptide repeat protein [Chelativorans intermedius]